MQYLADSLLKPAAESCKITRHNPTTNPISIYQGLPTSDSLLVLAEGMAKEEERRKRERSHTINSVGGKKKRSRWWDQGGINS